MKKDKIFEKELRFLKKDKIFEKESDFTQSHHVIVEAVVQAEAEATEREVDGSDRPQRVR